MAEARPLRQSRRAENSENLPGRQIKLRLISKPWKGSLSFFQGLEKSASVFPILGKNSRETFQSLEKPPFPVSNPWKTPRSRLAARLGLRRLKAASQASAAALRKSFKLFLATPRYGVIFPAGCEMTTSGWAYRVVRKSDLECSLWQGNRR